MKTVVILSKPQKEELAVLIPELILWMRAHGLNPVLDPVSGNYTHDAPVVPRNEMASLEPELAIVLRGRVRLKLGPDVHVLGQSDSICYDITVPHQWTNVGPGPTEVVLINTHFTPLDEWPGIFDPANEGSA